ncbi:hypothetical protein KP79_PYT19415 [Mizuhopecten yessoensis]|uniref:Cyclic nucleotide-binding domain-containing protein n=1 Tax=Mizuhopecten yessoensis TaxID=6573 RepID=A0A210PP28_MIZYE|nr:hypothetical protein KP79_PYT19415 [Mizuhopecten yessoensis]
MAAIVNQVIGIITKPTYKRKEVEIEAILPWLRKRSLLLQNLDRGVLQDIMKNCTYQACERDEIIIRQGEKGDRESTADVEPSFYVILSGSTSVYIDPRMTGEEEGGTIATEKTTPPKVAEKPKSEDGEGGEEQEEVKEEGDEEEEERKRLEQQEQERKLMKLDRNKFGKFIMTYEPGKAFGEVALVKRDALRNASIIADENCDLMVIGQDLYERSLKADQEKEFAQITAFIDSHPFFSNMSSKFKKLLEMSLRKETYTFDTVMIKQGDPVIGLHFLLQGQAKIVAEPHKHPKQYPHLWPFEAGIDIISVEFAHLREARRAAILRKYEDPSVWETKTEDTIIRREQGYAAVEKWMKEKHIELCSVQAGEVLGDIETLMNFNTYMQTVKCTSNTEVYILDSKNFERLVGKRNLSTTEVMRAKVIEKLKTRVDSKHGHLVPLLKFLHFKMNEQSLPPPRELPKLKTTKVLPDKDVQNLFLLQAFKSGKAPLVEPIVPGTLYYKDLMKEKAKSREMQRKAEGKTVASTTSTLRANKRNKPKRQPRSLMAIRESLRQMMEADVIQVDNKSTRKKLGSKYGSTVSLAPSNQSQQLFPPIVPVTDSKPKLDNSRSFMTMLNSKSHEKETPVREVDITPRDHETVQGNSASQDQKKVSPRKQKPVLITETAAPKRDVDLPMITEERTQEEIVLHKKVSGKYAKEGDTLDGRVALPAIKVTSTDRSQPRVKQQQQSSNPGEIVFPNNVTGERLVLPSIEGTEDASSPERKGKWGSAMKFVNEEIQQRLTNEMEDGTFQREIDSEFHDKAMVMLESKIESFNVQHGGPAKCLPKLARFAADTRRYRRRQEDEINSPKPGGKVWIRKRMCRFADNKVQVKDHQHVRHYIVNDLPQFDQVSRRSEDEYDSYSLFSQVKA